MAGADLTTDDTDDTDDISESQIAQNLHAWEHLRGSEMDFNSVFHYLE